MGPTIESGMDQGQVEDLVMRVVQGIGIPVKLPDLVLYLKGHDVDPDVAQSVIEYLKTANVVTEADADLILLEDLVARVVRQIGVPVKRSVLVLYLKARGVTPSLADRVIEHLLRSGDLIEDERNGHERYLRAA